MDNSQAIVAYLHKGEWHKAEAVQAKRVIDRGSFSDAHPYTVRALRNRRDYGRDVPEWINLDEQGDRR